MSHPTAPVGDSSTAGRREMDGAPDFAATAERALASLSGPDGAGHVVIQGLLNGFLPTDPTPPGWDEAVEGVPFDKALCGFASALGEALAWKNQQSGRLVHNIVPREGHEKTQTGAGSTSELLLHTEDAFHPDRARFLVLACVRNPGTTGTYVADVRDVDLDEADWDQLGRQVVSILPDETYGEASEFSVAETDTVATVWNGPRGRHLRFDPAYSILPDDEKFSAAYSRLGDALVGARRLVALSEGDVAILDNDIVVHGRAPFEPRFDGTDRWLKRVLVSAPGGRPDAEGLESGYGQSPQKVSWEVGA